MIRKVKNKKISKNILHCSACSPNIYIKQKTFNKTYSDMNCKIVFCRQPNLISIEKNKNFSHDFDERKRKPSSVIRTFYL